MSQTATAPLYAVAVEAARALHNAALRWGARCYAGITDDVRRRFAEHNVSPRGPWAWVECSSEHVARQAEAILLQAGYEGGPGGGSVATRFAYVYAITPNTREA